MENLLKTLDNDELWMMNYRLRIKNEKPIGPLIRLDNINLNKLK